MLLSLCGRQIIKWDCHRSAIHHVTDFIADSECSEQRLLKQVPVFACTFLCWYRSVLSSGCCQTRRAVVYQLYGKLQSDTIFHDVKPQLANSIPCTCPSLPA